MPINKAVKYQDKFNQLDLNSLNLYPDEQIAHCIGFKIYIPEYLVTSKGRVWSLSSHRWLKPQFKNNYWVLNPKDENRKTKK